AMSVCSPTRISIMTGQNAARHHATNWIRPWDNNAGDFGPKDWDWEGLAIGDITLPLLLAEEGYKTIHVGKGHFGPNDTEGENPANLGFNINIAGRAVGAPGSFYGEKNYGWGGKRERSAVPHLEAYHSTETFLTEALTIEAKKVIKKTVADEEPFYLYFSHYAVHAPFESDPRFAAHYEDSDKPANAKAFATLIEGMDKSLGDMMDQFEELGVAEDTLIIFLGDNGSDAPLGDQHVVACSAPLRGKKGAHYEGGMRVPFIAAWAKPNPENQWQKKLPIPQGAIQSQVADVTDIFPTLLNLLAVDAPEDHAVDGLLLDTLLTGEADATRENQFLMHYPHGPHRSSYYSVWRDGDWKVIFHALPDFKSTGGVIQSDGARFQLFNLAEDPFEQNDLAASNPDELKRMVAELAAQLEAHDAQYTVDEEGNPIIPSAAMVE
ncbi:MAG: sulfatase-like hydrolase/transferase, partial [Verrucomicrobiota bacterium]